MGSYQGKRRRKLLISISRYTKHLKDMSRGLGSARLIVSFCLESIFMGKRYSSKPSMMCFIWLFGVVSKVGCWCDQRLDSADADASSLSVGRGISVKTNVMAFTDTLPPKCPFKFLYKNPLFKTPPLPMSSS